MRIITIKTDGAYEVMNIQKGLEALRKAVGGDIEGHTFSGHTDFIVFFNEIGKLVNCDLTDEQIDPFLQILYLLSRY